MVVQKLPFLYGWPTEYVQYLKIHWRSMLRFTYIKTERLINLEGQGNQLGPA